MVCRAARCRGSAFGGDPCGGISSLANLHFAETDSHTLRKAPIAKCACVVTAFVLEPQAVERLGRCGEGDDMLGSAVTGGVPRGD